MHIVRRTVLLGILILGACSSSPEVRTDYDRTADFARYRSFGFMQPAGAGGYASLNTERLRAEARRQMEARGYVYAADNPDLLLNFDVKFEERGDVLPSAAPPWPYRAGFYNGWAGYTPVTYDQYTQGTLAIDIVDRARQAMVWQGVAVARGDERMRHPSEERLSAVVAEVFARYPFRAGSGVAQPPLRPAR